MKTILYNPIFINPQAYYVFPQLYDIEKGDQFIEPAVYSGYLLIEDLISNTSSQVTDTREVDFTQFAGKRIRISQYTNIGAVVLGEWLLPEGEQSGPSFHESLVDAWIMSGLSNSTKPTEIIGVKGNSLQLKNFTYALNSGFGEYATDFNSWAHFNSIETTSNKIMLGGIGFRNIVTTKKAVPELKILVSGFKGNIAYKYKTGGSFSNITINDNGVYTLPASEAIINTDTDINRLYTTNASADYSGMTIELLPTAYEGALMFDGVDDYGICTGLPILDDYTVICRRVIEGNRSANVVASKSVTTGKGAFIFEIFDTKNNTWSFGVQNDVDINYNDSVSWQTKKSYNGEKNLVVGSGSDTDTLCLGLLREKDSRCLKGAIYYFALYDKSLTPEEIEEEKVKLESEWEGGKNELA